MNFFVALLVLFAWCATQVASDANYVVTFDAHAPITELIYTLNIPAASPDPTISGDAQGIWVGVLTADGQTLFRNVVENQDDGPHSWAMKSAYCCGPYTVLNTPEQVYRGDSLQVSLVDNTRGDGQTPQWVDSIYIARNPADILLHPGLPLAVRPYSATISLDTSKYPVPSPFTQAMFTIELHGSGTWDWGEVVWQDVYIQALTTGTDWCTHPFANSNFAVALDAPVVTVDGEYTLCYIEQFTFMDRTRVVGTEKDDAL